VYSGLNKETVCSLLAGLCFFSGICALLRQETAGHALDEVQNVPFPKPSDSVRQSFRPVVALKFFFSTDEQREKFIHKSNQDTGI